MMLYVRASVIAQAVEIILGRRDVVGNSSTTASTSSASAAETERRLTLSALTSLIKPRRLVDAPKDAGNRLLVNAD